jgi:hypothetical protein
MFDGKGNNQHSGDVTTKLTQRQAAQQAGLSKDQQVQAVRMANIPEAKFEMHVEAEKPLSTSGLFFV